MALERIPTETGAILYDPSRIDHPRAEDFEPEGLARAGRIQAATAGRGSAWFVAARGRDGNPDRRWVLRHYRRGGLVARLVYDRYLWLGERATRSFAELALLAELERLGLPAARPVAARYVRCGATYRADLLTEAVPDVRTLADCLRDGVDASSWRAVGAAVAALHAAGVCHADLNAHNVLLAGDGTVTLVDFDRGRRRAPGRWAAANRSRLRRSLDKLSVGIPRPVGDEEWAAFEQGYRMPRNAPPR